MNYYLLNQEELAEARKNLEEINQVIANLKNQSKKITRAIECRIESDLTFAMNENKKLKEEIIILKL